MSMGKRIDLLEQAHAPPDPAVKFGMCQAPKELSPAEHSQWHEERGEHCFTLNIGECDVT